MKRSLLFACFLSVATSLTAQQPVLQHSKGETIVLVGNGLGSRMMQYGYFETETYLRHPDKNLIIRNLCDEGNTPGFRPQAARPNPWAFPGAEAFTKQLKGRERYGTTQLGRGTEKSPDEWLKTLKPDTVIAFFGFNESFEGPEGMPNFRNELTGYVKHLKASTYSKRPPQVVLVSPTAFQDVSKIYNASNGVAENKNLAAYADAVAAVAKSESVTFVDLFNPTKAWFAGSKETLTIDGALLNDRGYKKLAPLLTNALYGKQTVNAETQASLLKTVRDKNWYWHNYFKIPNGVHVYGVRNKPYGPDNYPAELKKLAEMIQNRDQAIWASLQNKTFDLKTLDAATTTLPKVRTNYKSSVKNGSTDYQYGEETLKPLKLAPGFKAELFASEKEFPDLANPVQMSFDNRGRLWVATMPSYPHFKPGDAKPNDKLLILEDTDNDGKADRQTVFADGLHLPIGFELAPEGVYVAQLPYLVLLSDTDGDDVADRKEILFGGFDDHDTHHAISAFSADPSGAIYMCEGTFLHSNVETARGPSRNYGGGFFRFDPRTRHLERSARLGLPNPWGVAVDEWGQNFYIIATNFQWMLPGTVKTKYGQFAPTPEALIKKGVVRPTCGVEFISSRHFPDQFQGDVLINNTIGFRGAKQHQVEENGTGYKLSHRQDLFASEDGNFRPVDLEFAPDGSLFVIDWHNVLIGHMQHNARDPLRDVEHGRIYRLTYPDRPLVEPAKIHKAPLSTLFDNLKLPEYRSRYRTRRELRGRNAGQVTTELKKWVAKLDAKAPRYEHHLLEALWVTWGAGKIDDQLLRKLLASSDHRVQSAAVNVLRYSGTQVADKPALLAKAASAPHGRVRLEAVNAASWMTPEEGLPVVEAAKKAPADKLVQSLTKIAEAQLTGQEIAVQAKAKLRVPKHLKGLHRKNFIKGHEIYEREGYCGTCHQDNGKGLPAAQFPPLAKSRWVTGSEERLIKITLHGLLGPIEVNGVAYEGKVPMTAFKQLSDQEIASVLTYVRNAFGNKAKPVSHKTVQKVRNATKKVDTFYNPADLLKAHPH